MLPVSVSVSSCAGSPLLVYCTEACISSVLLVLFCACVVLGLGFGNFCWKVGGVRFPGEFGELAAYASVPYLR